MTFLDGSLALGTAGVVNGQATFTTSNLAAGSYTVTAAYGGTTEFAASRSGVETTSASIQVGYWHTGPDGVAADSVGDLFIANSESNDIVEVTPKGVQTTVISGLDDPSAVAFDNGELLIADSGNNRVIKLTPSGMQTIGSGLDDPTGLAVDTSGDVFIADFGNGRVVEVPPNGPQTAISGPIQSPSSVAVDGAGDLFIAELTVGRAVVATLGFVSQLDDNLSNPHGVAADSAGDVFIADTSNNRVVEISRSGVPQTIASGLSQPYGVAVDANGDLFISEHGNNDVLEEFAGVPVTVSPLTTSVSVLASSAAVSLGQSETFTAIVTSPAAPPPRPAAP